MEEMNKVNEEQEQLEKEVDMLNTLIRGENDIFEKEYTFKELKESLKVKVRYPTLIERGRINAIREEMLYGMGKYQPELVFVVFNTVAVLEVCGIDVPKYLRKESSPRDDVLYRIGLDLSVWLNSFR